MPSDELFDSSIFDENIFDTTNALAPVSIIATISSIDALGVSENRIINAATTVLGIDYGSLLELSSIPASGIVNSTDISAAVETPIVNIVAPVTDLTRLAAIDIGEIFIASSISSMEGIRNLKTRVHIELIRSGIEVSMSKPGIGVNMDKSGIGIFLN